MKSLLWIIWISLPIQLFAQSAATQSVSINEDFDGVALKEVLTLLKDKYGIKTAYGERVISDYRISASLAGSTPLEAFQAVLSGTGLDYEMIDPDVFIISRHPDGGSFEKVSLTGIVQDALTGESLPYTYIWSASQDRSLITNVDGYFVLNDWLLPDTLTVSYLGYQDTTVVVTLHAAHSRFKIPLRPHPQYLKEVLVKEDKPEDFELNETAGKITFNPNIASSVPSTGEVDVFRSLQLLPGINATNETSSGLTIRGGTTNQNLVLFDGFTVYHVDHFFGYFSAFNPNAVKSVRVFKGGFGAEYGGRVSSIIDITGKDGNRYDVTGSLSLNLLSINTSLELPLTNNNTTLFFSGRRSYTDIITTPLFENIFANFSSSLSQGTGTNPDGSANQGQSRGGGNHMGGQMGDMTINNHVVVTEESTIEPTFYYNDFNVKVSSNISPRDRLSVSLYNSKDLLNFTENATSNVNDTLAIATNTVGLINWGNLGSSVKLSRLWNKSHFSNFLLSYSAYKSTYSDISTSTSTGQNSTTTANSSTDQDNGMKDLSVKWDHEWQQGRGLWMFGASSSLYTTHYVNTTDNEKIVDEVQVNRLLSNAYAQYKLQSIANLEMNMGLRASYFSPTDRFYVMPRLSMIWSVRNKVRLKASYGQYNQFLNQINSKNVLQGSRDFWILADNDRIPVQHAIHYLAGFDYQITNQSFFSLDGYYRTFDGLLEYAFSNGGLVTEFANFENLFFEGSGYAKGVELLFKQSNPLYQAWIGYTYGQVIYTFDDLNGGNPFYADHDQRHEVNAYGSVKLGRFDLFATWLYGSGRPYSLVTGARFGSMDPAQIASHVSVLSLAEKNGERLPPYHRLDLGVTYLFSTGKLKGETTLSVFNAYNRTNVQDIKINRLAGGTQERMFMDEPILQTYNVTLLGISPNLSVKVSF